ASVGLTRSEANELVKRIVPLYAGDQNLGEAIQGVPFQEAYDVETVQPLPEWQRMYEETCQEMEDLLGLTL
ncbi:MAG: monomethylamine:corrinoid methyltransferase, partial [Anaerolineales bacterium]|nr:monomethylamine:corrinoid methyltransferase [Anaerolineales bacterium]